MPSIVPWSARIKWTTILVLFVYFVRRLMRKRRNQARNIPGKTVLITGGGHGMGRRTAMLLAKRQASRIILWDVNEANLKETKNAILKECPECDVTIDIVDISDKDKVQRAAINVLSRCVPDFLILNAGIAGEYSHISDVTEANLKKVYSVNVFQLYYVTSAFLPNMQSVPESKIVVLASVAALFQGTEYFSVYSSSKCAAFGFAESLYWECRLREVETKVSAVLPIYVDTGMFAGVRTSAAYGFPLLSQDWMADQIVTRAVLDDDFMVCMPYLAYLHPILKNLPFDLTYWYVHFAGGFKAMHDVLKGKDPEYFQKTQQRYKAID